MGKYPVVDPGSISRESLLEMIDYTLLRPEEGVGAYRRFLEESVQWGFRTAFVPPCHVPMAVEMTGESEVVVGTPVSFPFGYSSSGVKAAEAVSALDDGARELDVVLNVTAAVSGEWELVRKDLDEVVTAVRSWEKASASGPIIIKLILETPYLDDAGKVEACRAAEGAGIDFVKTATGLGPGGATVEDIALMREVVGERLGVKASGGIRTWGDAREMIAAGANRIGTSTGPRIIEDFDSGRAG